MGTTQSFVESRDIFGTMKEEKMILIKAQVTSGAARFSVDLVCQNGDIAFHFNPRFDETPPVIVCNTSTKARWGKEDRTSFVPFRWGESFQMTITVKSAGYEVSINGKPLLTYVHRLPYHTVKKLQFRGDVSLEEVGYSSAKACASASQDPPPYSPLLQADTETTKIEIDNPKNKE